ncbi:MAG TPA: tail fiber domain-containing protein [Candidatus Thermoplasmatota archaeon]|nr:tail fiber domain-containing protein [Candidatus Thermoplasmatota archaeon]
MARKSPIALVLVLMTVLPLGHAWAAALDAGAPAIALEDDEPAGVPEVPSLKCLDTPADTPQVVDECGDIIEGQLFMNGDLVMAGPSEDPAQIIFMAGSKVSFLGGDLMGDDSLTYHGSTVCVAGTAIPGCGGVPALLAGAGISIGGTAPTFSIGIADGGIGPAQLADRAVTQAKIELGAVTGDRIANSAIGPAQLADQAVTQLKIAPGAVTTDRIANGAVGAAQLAEGAVVASKLATGSVGSGAIADGAVTGAGILNGTITASDVAPGAVTSGGILDGTVTGGDIANGTITASKTDAATVQARVTGYCNGTQFIQAINQDGTVTCLADANSGGTVSSITTGAGLTGGPITANGTISIATGGVTSAMVLDGTIAAGDLANDAVTSAAILDGTVASADLATGAVTSAGILDATITASDIAAGAVVSASILDGTITASDLATGAVTSASILDATITASDLATGAVTSAAILDGTITGTDLANGTITSAKTDTTSVQARVTGACADGKFLQAINQDGTVSCLADTNSGGTVTSITTGAGLSGGPITGTGTIGIANGGVVNSMLQNNSLTFTAGSGLSGGGSAALGGNTSLGIATGGVTSGMILDGTIGTGDLANGAVTGSAILNGTIAAGDLAPGAVTSAGILDATITASDIAAGAVVSASILDGTITTSDLATGAVTSAAILDGTITASDIANGTITSAKTDANTVQTRVIGNCTGTQFIQAINQDGTVTCLADANSGGTVTSITTGAGLTGGPITANGTISIANGGVVNSMLQNSSLTFNAGSGLSGGGSAALGGSTSLGIATGGVISAMILDGTIGANDIAAGAVTSSAILNGTIAANDLANGAVTNAAILDGTIGAADLATGAVTSAGILDATITGSDLATGAVTSAAILNGTITATDLANGAVTAAKTDPTTVQARVLGSCGEDAAAGINQDGSMDCVKLWSRTGNSGTSPMDVLGTRDEEPLNLVVSDRRALRLEPGGSDSAYGASPNVLGGPMENSADPQVAGAVIGGGGSALTPLGGPNRVSDNFGTIAGGLNNLAGDGEAGTSVETAKFATVGGGAYNTASASSATVAGGDTNKASGPTAAIGGGAYNEAKGEAATIAGGASNRATGMQSTVPGGMNNEALGDLTFAAGNGARAAHKGAFIWADSNSPTFSTDEENQFAVRATGGARFVTAITPTGAATAGVQLNPGSGAWSSLSDRNAKQDIVPVSPRDILARLAAMPVSAWSYIASPGVRHMGPMAQDFRAAFGLGEDDTHITTIDEEGVALAAIQGLHLELQDRDARIADLEEHNADLEERLERLEGLLAGMAAP